MATSVGLSLAASAPTLIDEAMASQNALSMMNSMGNRASLGQRGRLAGGYLTYVAPVVATAVGANIVGNLMDDELTSKLGYGSEQTEGTLMP